MPDSKEFHETFDPIAEQYLQLVNLSTDLVPEFAKIFKKHDIELLSPPTFPDYDLLLGKLVSAKNDELKIYEAFSSIFSQVKLMNGWEKAFGQELTKCGELLKDLVHNTYKYK